MWELIQELNIVQWALIIGGIVLIYPVFFKTDERSTVPVVPKPLPQPKPIPSPIDLDSDFVNVVETWAILRSKCQKTNLDEAEAKLLEVFPLLVKQENIE